MTNTINTILNKITMTQNEDARWNVCYEMSNEKEFYELCNDEDEVVELFIMMQNDFIPESIKSNRDYVNSLYSYHNGIINMIEEIFFRDYGEDWNDKVDSKMYINVYVDYYYDLASQFC